MSALAQALSGVTPEAQRVRRGPIGECAKVYPEGDLEDWLEVERLRSLPNSSWREAQRIVDEQLGVERPIDNDKFRYHWRRRCFCWPDDLRQA